jgi:hypothetical protein
VNEHADGPRSALVLRDDETERAILPVERLAVRLEPTSDRIDVMTERALQT